MVPPNELSSSATGRATPHHDGCAMSTRTNQGKVTNKGKAEAGQASLTCSVDEIREMLDVGRSTAYAIARELGRRVRGKRRGRLIVSRHALEAWLHGEAAR